MAILFSDEFEIPRSILQELGVFDAVLDADSHFFININRLKETEVPEFLGSYERINEYFRKIGLLLSNAQVGNKAYRAALKLFDFPEVNGINLGFSKGKRGAGFGKKLRDQIIKDAYEIIKSGTSDPELFHLIGLFEENVGPDRLSDMIARLIYEDIINYSKRIYSMLKITPHKYPNYHFLDGIPMNPYKDVQTLLLPTNILHELPIARDWSDVNRVCIENEAIRAELNLLVGEEWHKMTVSMKKAYLKKWIFMNPDRLTRVLDAYKNTSVGDINLYSDIDYLLAFLESSQSIPKETQENSHDAAMSILSIHKQWIEDHRGSEVLSGVETRKGETIVQRTIHAIALPYCSLNNWDFSPESDSGRGPVDFKVSRGNDKTVIEVKLTSNSRCVHGLQVQIEEYAKAEQTNNKIFVLIDNGKNSQRVQSVLKAREQMISEGKSPATIFNIDANPKASASTY